MTYTGSNLFPQPITFIKLKYKKAVPENQAQPFCLLQL